MPPTSRTNNGALNIQLEANQLAYFPGDTIIGCVSRKTPIVTPQARIQITLHGRTKTKLVRSNGQSSTTYRGRFDVVNSRRLGQCLFEGPVHIDHQNGEQSWPFALTIPTYVECLGERSDQDTFIPSDDVSMSTHTLPPSFVGLHHSKEGFVEYWLQAELVSRGNRDHKTVHADLPFLLKQKIPAPPITQMNLRQMNSPHTVVSQRLLPGMETDELSTSQRMKKFFHSSSVPRFHFRLEVVYPTTIQLDHPNPLHWKIRAVPDWGQSSPELDQIPQKVQILGGSMEIRQITHIKCSAYWSSSKDDTFDDKADLRLEVPFGRAARAGQSIEVPCTSEWPMLDLGQFFDMRLGYNGFPWNPSYSHGKLLTPSFATYNLKVQHTLKWTLRVLVAKEEVKCRIGETPIVLLGSPDGIQYGGNDYTAPPSLEERRTESWIQPPAEEEPPPSFAEVQKEDKKGSSEKHTALLENGGSASKAG